MSQYAEIETKIRDAGYLRAALKEMGLEVETFPAPQEIVDYDGNTVKVDMMLRRKSLLSWAQANVGYMANWYNDVGFTRREDGTYAAAFIEGYDANHAGGKGFLKSLTMKYEEVRQIAVAKARGYIFGGRQVVGEEVKLRFYQR